MKATIATPRALSAVYREHHAFVWRSLRCLGVVDTALDDAVQDVFVVVHRRLGQFEGRASVRTWLYQIARRIAWRYRQRASRDAARSFELPELHDGPHLDEAVARAQALEILRAFVDGLDEDKAAVFLLTEFGGLQGHEIARDLDVNVNTVHARLRAARAQLRRMVQRLQARERSAPLPAPERLAPVLAEGRPPARARRRTWSLLVAKLGLAPPAAPWWAAVPSKVVAAAVAMPVAIAVVVWGASDGPHPEVTATRTDIVIASAGPPPVGRSPSAPPATPRPAQVAAAPNASPAPHGSSPAPATESPTRSPPRTSATASPPSTATAAGPPPTTATTTDDALPRELAMVRSIRSALARDRPAKALQLTAKHRREHATGALVPEVAALNIEALCATGRTAQAVEASSRFAARWPQSSLRPDSAPCQHHDAQASIASR
ncbi:MAG: sigma-70 family RNA polymerase sigma factor [Deltaproteobacteria bacterium]|nr:sigma-70 family RNA polymerase sigma factor [Deltaproteobacteria bacterium]